MNQIEFMMKLYELLYKLISAIISSIHTGEISTTY